MGEFLADQMNLFTSHRLILPIDRNLSDTIPRLSWPWTKISPRILAKHFRITFLLVVLFMERHFRGGTIRKVLSGRYYLKDALGKVSLESYYRKGTIGKVQSERYNRKGTKGKVIPGGYIRKGTI